MGNLLDEIDDIADKMTCYASTIDEHPPNGTAKRLHEIAKALRSLSDEQPAKEAVADAAGIRRVWEEAQVSALSDGTETDPEFAAVVNVYMAGVRAALPSADPRPSEQRVAQRRDPTSPPRVRHFPPRGDDRRKPTERAAQQGGQRNLTPPSQEGHAVGPAVAARPQDEAIRTAIMRSAMERGWSQSGSWAVAEGALKLLAAAPQEAAPKQGSDEYYEAFGAEVEKHPIGGRAAPQAPREAQAVAQMLLEQMGITQFVEVRKEYVVKVCRALLSARPAPEGWVSVSERLPEPFVPVLVRCESYDASYQDGCDIALLIAPADAWVIGKQQEPAHNVTHWQPLPATPEPREPRKDTVTECPCEPGFCAYRAGYKPIAYCTRNHRAEPRKEKP